MISNREILEQQELEYAIALIEDMKREDQATKEESTEQIDEEKQDDITDKTINPSPKSLRSMRQAYFDKLATREANRESSQTQPQFDSSQTQPQCDSSQTQSSKRHTNQRRLRSGRSF